MDNDFVLLTEKEAMWAGILEEVLKDNGIEYAAIPVFGAGLALKAGMQERFRIFVPADRMPEAEELLHELFSADETRPFQE
ncbi:MAG: DUF2007 domain-containing protein [Oscillospiraceae bacterium]|jgi:hypothetical protein|nr:DUF2007 domain-containing protein [Oscillospiraceae bacterium]